METMENNLSEKFIRAKKRVAHIKNFYKHLRVYIVGNLGLLVLKYWVLNLFQENGINDPDVLNWFKWNIIGTLVVWGIGLAIHALYVFKFQSRPLRLKDLKPGVLKEWEDRQIKKYMDEDIDKKGD